MGFKAYAVIRSSGFGNVPDTVQVIPDDKEEIFWSMREDDCHQRFCIELDLPDGCFVGQNKIGAICVFGPHGYKLEGWCNAKRTRLTIVEPEAIGTDIHEILNIKIKV